MKNVRLGFGIPAGAASIRGAWGQEAGGYLGQVDALAETLLYVRHQLRPDNITRLGRGVLANWIEI